jgi:hypothetical protein
MRLICGEAGRKYTRQDEFPKTVLCGKKHGDLSCDGRARLAFVYCEEGDDNKFLCNMRKDTDKLWIHDACSVAVYFCNECLGAHVLWNQG